MGNANAHLDGRRRAHDLLAARLAALNDEQLSAVLAAQTTAWHTHAHGGQSGVIDVDGAKVFVKTINLTDLERTADNAGSTANLFDLPVFYQYGVGSAGFGGWRELSAYRKASTWALSGDCQHFPLLHHWRVLPRTTPPRSAKHVERLDWFTNYWDRSDAVRARLEAAFDASASIVLFLEYVPQMLHAWIKPRLTGERLDSASEAAILRAYDQLQETAAFMNDHGMLHFDLHAYNVLTDGERIYAVDFGLALCADFDLSPAERAFFDTHRLYDRGYIDWAFVDAVASKEDPPLLTPALSARVDRCAPVANILESFFTKLREESKATPYPATELEAALAAQPKTC